jgi:DNA ligase-1
MRLETLAAASAEVAGTGSRTAKVARLAEVLRQASPAVAVPVSHYLAGSLPQRRTGLGPAAVRDLPAPASAATLTVADADQVFAWAAQADGPGSTTARRAAFHDLMARATPAEQQLLAGLVTGELRQGAAAGLLADAVAAAIGVPVAEVHAATTLAGSVQEVAAAVLQDGAGALGRFRLRVGAPLAPMLAQSAPTTHEALERFAGEVGIEWKLDGIRVQLHRDGTDVAVFSRSGEDVTARLPEVVEQVLGLPVTQLVLDGEALVLGVDGRPRPFQETGSRVGRRTSVNAARAAAPLTTFVFDALHLDGQDLLARPGRERWALLDEAAPSGLVVPRTLTADPTVAAAVAHDAQARGHEGVVVKSPDIAYQAGRRGAGWVKVKPRHTFDLVVLAAEWGHGRRQGWLSNLHLGARDPHGLAGPPGGLVMLGKTFKGMTDVMLGWQTERLLALASGPTDGWVVPVRPELVVEIAVDGVQRSTRYPGGVALRFARVVRYRTDKAVSDADPLEAVQALLAP